MGDLTKSRWRFAVCALVLAAGIGVWRHRPWVSVDPLVSGLKAYAAGDWAGSAAAARDRLKQRGEDPVALRLLARSSSRLARDASTVAIYRRLPAELLEAEDYYLIGAVTERSGDKKGSMTLWETALAAAPDHAETLFAASRGFLMSQLYQPAGRTARRLAGIPGWQARGDGLLGNVLIAQNDAVGAAACWQRALDRQLAASGGNPAADLRIDLARALLCLGQGAKARPHLQAVLALGSNQEASWLLSRAFLQEGRSAEAAEAFQLSGGFGGEQPTRFDPAPYVGAARCAGCHAEKYRTQSASHHAETFHRAGELKGLSLASPTIADPAEPGVTHTLRAEQGRLEQETRVDDRVFKAVVDYAFGSGDLGHSLIGRDEAGKIRELRMSVYHEGGKPVWDVTPGQPQHQSDKGNYLGARMTADHVYSCFNCHVTNPRAAIQNSGPESKDAAIGCEKCHGPGGNHVIAVAGKFPDLAIGRPALASGLPVIKICAQCHNGRLDQPIRPEEPDSVHFQTATLTWSRCYQESEGGFDCVSCHDPHRNASRDHAEYETRCLVCHSQSPAFATPARGSARTLSPALGRERVTCPVNPRSGCVSCHMPRVQGVMPHMNPTDHFIRVHDAPPSPGPVQPVTRR